MGAFSMTFSLDRALLDDIEDHAHDNGVNRSQAIRYLVKMGLVYLKVLESQQQEMLRRAQSGDLKGSEGSLNVIQNDFEAKKKTLYQQLKAESNV